MRVLYEWVICRARCRDFCNTGTLSDFWPSLDFAPGALFCGVGTVISLLAHHVGSVQICIPILLFLGCILLTLHLPRCAFPELVLFSPSVFFCLLSAGSWMACFIYFCCPSSLALSFFCAVACSCRRCCCSSALSASSLFFAWVRAFFCWRPFFLLFFCAVHRDPFVATAVPVISASVSLVGYLRCLLFCLLLLLQFSSSFPPVDAHGCLVGGSCILLLPLLLRLRQLLLSHLTLLL